MTNPASTEAAALDLLRRAKDVCHEAAMGGQFAAHNGAVVANAIDSFLQGVHNASLRAHANATSHSASEQPADAGVGPVAFPPVVYECGCGSQKWFILNDLSIVCTECRCETTVLKAERLDDYRSNVARKGTLNG